MRLLVGPGSPGGEVIFSVSILPWLCGLAAVAHTEQSCGTCLMAPRNALDAPQLP